MTKQRTRPLTGSLKDRDGKYTAIVNYYDENGKRQQKYHALGIPVKGNKRKAEAALQELLCQYEGEEVSVKKAKEDSPLMADFLWDWLKITAPTIERTTLESYEGLIKARMDGFFYERKLCLCDLDPKHTRELHQSIFADRCNANTVIHYHVVVHKAPQYAVKNELVAVNVADKVDHP